MRDMADMAERHGDNLAELAEMGMTLARDLHGRALAAQDDKAAAELTLAFQRVSRSVRQSMALEARLERERKAGLREETQAQRQQMRSHVQKKRAQVRSALSPLIWTEAEGDEDAAEAFFEGLQAMLMDESFIDEAFVEEPIEAVVERIRAGLGLAPAPANTAAQGKKPAGALWASSA